MHLCRGIPRAGPIRDLCVDLDVFAREMLLPEESQRAYPFTRTHAQAVCWYLRALCTHLPLPTRSLTIRLHEEYFEPGWWLRAVRNDVVRAGQWGAIEYAHAFGPLVARLAREAPDCILYLHAPPGWRAASATGPGWRRCPVALRHLLRNGWYAVGRAVPVGPGRRRWIERRVETHPLYPTAIRDPWLVVRTAGDEDRESVASSAERIWPLLEILDGGSPTTEPAEQQWWLEGGSSSLAIPAHGGVSTRAAQWLLQYEERYGAVGAHPAGLQVALPAMVRQLGGISPFFWKVLDAADRAGENSGLRYFLGRIVAKELRTVVCPPSPAVPAAGEPSKADCHTDAFWWSQAASHPHWKQPLDELRQYRRQHPCEARPVDYFHLDDDDDPDNDAEPVPAASVVHVIAVYQDADSPAVLARHNTGDKAGWTPASWVTFIDPKLDDGLLLPALLQCVRDFFVGEEWPPPSVLSTISLDGADEPWPAVAMAVAPVHAARSPTYDAAVVGFIEYRTGTRVAVLWLTDRRDRETVFWMSSDGGNRVERLIPFLWMRVNPDADVAVSFQDAPPPDVLDRHVLELQRRLLTASSYNIPTDFASTTFQDALLRGFIDDDDDDD